MPDRAERIAERLAEECFPSWDGPQTRRLMARRLLDAGLRELVEYAESDRCDVMGGRCRCGECNPDAMLKRIAGLCE